MLKRDELNFPTSCLNSADDDEPIFVLKSTDPLAPATVRFWADVRELEGKTRPEKIQEARSLASKMEDWQRLNPHKMKRNPAKVEFSLTTNELGSEVVQSSDMIITVRGGRSGPLDIHVMKHREVQTITSKDVGDLKDILG
jgi:hypothetical protein